MRILYLVLLIFMFNISTSLAGISSTFDTGLDGWTIEGRNNADGDILTSTGGSLSNPGGYLEAADLYYDWMFAVAPDKFHTDWGSHSTLSADIMGDSYTWHYSTVFFILNGDNKWKYEFDMNQVAHNEWRTLTAPIEETSWSQVSGTQSWDTTLSNVTDFWIRIDLASFSDTVKSEFNGIDNVTLAPEPVSSTLFAIGGLTLGLRLYRKNRRTV